MNDDRKTQGHWNPDKDVIGRANITAACRELGLADYDALWRWSVEERESFWDYTIRRLGIRFRREPSRVLDPASPVHSPSWLPGAALNIVDSCLGSDQPDAVTVVWGKASGELVRYSQSQFRAWVIQISSALESRGLKPGDAVAIVMPMTPEAVAIYLGIIHCGCVAVSIADSFAAPEIDMRLRIGQTKLVFTSHEICRDGKRFPMYEKVISANAPAVVLVERQGEDQKPQDVRQGDLSWSEFLGGTVTSADAFAASPDHPINILFSSGTTGEPKAIVWDQTTPIKCAADGHYHHDLHPGDVVCWPTNLGWMMGPWLIFAALMNRATIALFEDAPLGRPFGQFVQDARVNMLGLVPSLVRRWRETRCMEGLDWTSIHAFSSTGECSRADDMAYLMSLAGNRPVIEYCGGTEIGGGYITSTVVQPNEPGQFSTPALGCDFVLLDEQGRPSDVGEVFLIAPSIGFSRRLLNRDHFDTYFKETPTLESKPMLRRHGDQMQRLPSGYFRALGRADDTMKLGGIKISSAEIEQVVGSVGATREVAAVAVPAPDGGPSELVIFAVPNDAGVDRGQLLQQMQQEIRRRLNPLFKIADLRLLPQLPRTASNKLMRRELRAAILQEQVSVSKA